MQLMSVILGQLYAENTCGAMSMCIRESLTTAKKLSSISSATYNFYKTYLYEDKDKRQHQKQEDGKDTTWARR